MNTALDNPEPVFATVRSTDHQDKHMRTASTNDIALEVRGLFAGYGRIEALHEIGRAHV